MANLKPLTDKQKQRLARLYTNPLTKKYMEAGKASRIPFNQQKGLWRIDVFCSKGGIYMPAGVYVRLARYTLAGMHQDGETVMVDEPTELSKHLRAAMTAYGDVLVTGLGLGCVARMLQVNPKVKSVTIVERDQDVIDMVWPHMIKERSRRDLPPLELVRADAFDFLRTTDRRWDCAWHDIWTDSDKGEPHLQVAHARLMARCRKKVDVNLGAWAFPRNEWRYYQRMRKQNCQVERKLPWRVRQYA